ncbi:MAG: hypothetical protein ABIO44_11760 [Saprospiraceae bacterium]
MKSQLLIFSGLIIILASASAFKSSKWNEDFKNLRHEFSSERVQAKASTEKCVYPNPADSQEDPVLGGPLTIDDDTIIFEICLKECGDPKTLKNQNCYRRCWLYFHKK